MGRPAFICHGWLPVLFDQPQATQIVFSPTSAGQQISQHIRRQSVCCTVVVNHDAPAVPVAVDALAALTFGERKAIALEGLERCVASVRCAATPPVDGPRSYSHGDQGLISDLG